MKLSWSSVAGVVALLLALSGCGPSSSSSTPRAVQPRLDETELLQQDDLTLGLEYLNQVYEPGRYYLSPGQDPAAPPDVDLLAMYRLNQWLAREAKTESTWKPPALLTFVPKSLASIQPLQEIDRTRITYDDLKFLHGRIWQRDIARRITGQPLQEPWATWIEESIAPALSEEERKTTPPQLSAAIQLFDWTIRNVQLDPFPPAIEETPLGTSDEAGSSAKDANAPPPQRGVPGPGYQRYPYDTLLYGHGDAYERARVFIELCRQQRIETAMLAVAQKSGAVRPWAVAALVGPELYLFDAELGLPLPGENGRGVVTLAGLLKQPELLAQLNLDDKQTYWVKPDDLKALRPLISASPEELSRRMWLLDQSSKGVKHLALFVDADALAQRLAQSPPLKGIQVSLWKVPFECSLYVSLGLGQRLSRHPELAKEYDRETGFLRPQFSPLRQARQLQFQGSFDITEEARARRRERERDKTADRFPRDGGAVELYLLTRPEGRAIEELAYSEFWQRYYGLNGLPKDPKQRADVLEKVTAQIQRSRDDTSFWLGLVQYEKGDYTNAMKWLKSSLPQEGASDKPWSGGARYNLARCYESLGQADQAIKLYRSDDSPQKYGNRLRAKRLQLNTNTAER